MYWYYDVKYGREDTTSIRLDMGSIYSSRSWGRINQLLNSGIDEYRFYSASLSNIQLGLRPRRILLISAE